MDHLKSALKAGKAALIDPGEFRALDENARLLRPLVGREFQVWELRHRSARDAKQCRDWRLGARLGSNAAGLYSRMVSDLDATPPGIRKAEFREVVKAPRRPGQVGYPLSVAADAHLGFSVMAYQSAEVLFDRCEGVGHCLVRLAGTCARPRQGLQKGGMAPAQRTWRRPPNARGGAVPLRGGGGVAEGTRPLDGSLFCCSGMCAQLRLLVPHMGLGHAVPGAEASHFV